MKRIILLFLLTFIFSNDYAISFSNDNNEDYIEIDHTLIGSDDFSVSFWFKNLTYPLDILDSQGNQPFFIGNTSDWQIRVFPDYNEIYFGFCCTMPYWDHVATSIPNDELFHNIVAVSNGDNGDIKIYLDGVLVNTTSGIPAPVFGSGSNIRIGAPTNSYDFSSIIDNILILDRAMTQDEIYHNYITFDNYDLTDVIAYWPFNEGEGDVLYDLSGNDYHGTIYGSPDWILNEASLSNIYIPQDYPSIQQGINAASDGDTVFVAAGTYYENISFNGKNISLIGEDRETTIIDGGENTTVVIFENNDSNTMLNEFTITNGYAWHSGGIWCKQSSTPTITNCIIKNNRADYDGGGINISHSSPVINNCLIYDNESGGGGGIYIFGASSPFINNSTIVNNIAIGQGGNGIWWDSQNDNPILNNCIVWNNEITHNSGTVTITFSNIENGWEGIGNINDSPQLNDDYTLQSTSPCIDAGDPNSPLDPDGTIADMGAFYYHQTLGCTDNSALNYDFEVNSDDGSCIYIGDVTLNGTVNISDVVIIVDYLVNGYEFNNLQLQAADINQNGYINITDIVLLIELIFNL